MVVRLIDLPVKHSFYLDYGSHPIALGLAPTSNYRVLDTRVTRVQSKGEMEEYYLFEHLVEHIGREHPPRASFKPAPDLH